MKAYWKYLVLLGYIALTASVTAFHEPWRDEVQAWLLARDLPFLSLIKHIHFEGTPALWHILLFPFASTGASIAWMYIIHLIIAYGIVSTILFKAPFSPALKIGLLFSYFILWEYSIIARSYSLGILLLFLLAWQHPNRHLTPIRYVFLLALLFNTNVHSIFIASALSILFFFEILSSKAPRSRYSLPVLILMAGVSIAVWQLIPSSNTTNQGLFYIFSWRAPFIALSNAFFPEVPRTAYITTALALLIAGLHVTHLFNHSRKALFIFLLAYTGLFYLFTFKHTGSVRHHGLLFMILVYTYWISYQDYEGSLLKRLSELSLIGCMVLSTVFATLNYANEFRYPFSDAKNVAQFIDNPPYNEYTLVGHPSIKASSLLPYLTAPSIWYPDIQSFGSYITWNTAYERDKNISPEEVIQRVTRALPDENLLIIFDTPLSDLLSRKYDLVYSSPETIFGYGDERYFVYRAFHSSR